MLPEPANKPKPADPSVASGAPVVSAFGNRISFELGISAVGLIGLILLKAPKNDIIHAAAEAG
jgi:hypothetical protein